MKKLLFVFLLISINLMSFDSKSLFRDFENKSKSMNLQEIKQAKQSLAIALPCFGIVKAIPYIPTLYSSSMLFRNRHRITSRYALGGIIAGLFVLKKYNDYMIFGPGSTFKQRSLLYHGIKTWEKLNDRQNELEKRD